MLNVFYSYAHEDESWRRELDKHLSILKRQGLITGWHDREISAGAEWAGEIRTHLEAAQLILLLVSPDFLASDYCYSIEMTRAMERHADGAAHMIPIILRPCDWKHSPLSNLQVLPQDGLAVTSWTNQDTAFLNITEGIRKVVHELDPPAATSKGSAEHSALDKRGFFAQQQTRPRSDWYAHISLPPNYVIRADVITSVRDVLLSHRSPLALTSGVKYHKPNALHGMGGIGKSVIARALCDDPEVQARFPDGILWMTLGQTPELIPKMRDWVNALGGTISENAPTVDSLKVALAKLLESRACLLIIDDVWQFPHAEVFRVGGSNCRLLLTTRDAEIAHEVGATVQAIPIMTESEAITLLEEWASEQLNEVDHVLKKQIVKRLGYLPLAVKQAGAQLRHKNPKEWLHSFAVHKLKASRANANNVHDSLEQTFHLSLKELDENARHLYVALAIFKEDEPILQVGIERLWQGLSGFDSSETVDLLNDLAARALLQIDFSRKVILHDLLRDLIITEMKDRTIEVHQAILNAYRVMWSGTGWHTAIDDGYLYDHLVYHLHSAEAIDELKGLFANQQWLQKRVPQRNYTYDGYLSDLAVALKCAKAEAKQQIEMAQELSAFANCIRYLLIHTSINTIASNYIPELIARTIEVGLWKPHRALSIAAKVPGETEKVKMYVAILKTVGLSREQQRETQRMSLGVALAIESERRRAEVLAELAPYLTEELLEQGLEAALAIEDEQTRARVLAKLAPSLTGVVLEQALEAALAIENEESRAEVLAELAPHLTKELLEQALEAVLAIGNLWKQAEVLAKVLADVAPHLTEKLLERGLMVALVIGDEETRARVLAGLAPSLKGEDRVKALKRGLEAALALGNERRRAEVLAELAPYLTGEDRAKALKRGLEAALAIENEERRAEVLAKLAPCLTEELLGRALEAALAIENEERRARVLSDVAPHLTEKLLERGLMVALVVGDEETRARVLAGLAPSLAGEDRAKALERGLEAALAIENEERRAEVLAELAPYLTEELLGRGLEAALAIWNEENRADVLAKLAPYLTEELLGQGLEAALAIEDKWRRAEVLAELAPSLAGEDRIKTLEQGLEAALAIGDEERRARALAGLAPSLTGEDRVKTLEQGLEAALAIEDEWSRAEVLAKLAPHLTEKLLERGLMVALVVGDEETRARVLVGLAPYLTGEDRVKALKQGLEAALAIWNERRRAEVLAELAPYLTGEDRAKALEQGLEAALAIWNERRRAEVLAKLAPSLTGVVLEQALEAALAIEDEETRARVLAKLAPSLTGEDRVKALERGLEAALVLEDEWRRAEVLAKLAPSLTGVVLERALEAALMIKNGVRRAELLAIFLHFVSDQDRFLRSIRMLMLDSLLAIQHLLRGDMLALLFSNKEIFTPPIFSSKTLGNIVSHIVEICEEWNWL